MFSHLGIEDGLSQSTVFSILQDHEGYMWFATNNGLNRFDGYNFKVYKNDPLDSSSISDHSVTALYEDSDGYIWIGTKDGVLNKFNKSSEKFFRYKLTTEYDPNISAGISYKESLIAFTRNNVNTITAITEDKDNNLWIGTWGIGIIVFNKISRQQIHIHSLPGKSNQLSSNRVAKITIDRDGIVWVGTFSGGLNRIRKKTLNNLLLEESLEFTSFINDRNSVFSISGNDIVSVFEDSKGNIWAGTYGNGLNLLLNKNKLQNRREIVFDNYHHIGGNSISSNDVMAIEESADGRMWFGTIGGGLDMFDVQTGEFRNFKHIQFNANSLSDNDIISLFLDKSGILWIGNHFRTGLSTLRTSSVKFNLITKSTGQIKGLNDEVVWAIHEDKKDSNILWIGTYRGGLNKINRATGEFTYFVHDPDNPQSIADNHIRAIAEDKDGNLWLGNFSSGLTRFNKLTEKSTHFRYDPKNTASIGANQIQSIYIDSQSNFWLSCYGGGISSFKLDDSYDDKIKFKRFRHNPSDSSSLCDDRVYQIFENSRGEIWIGTTRGLSVFDIVTETFKNYYHNPENFNSIGGSNIMCVMEDSRNTMWIGTNGGGLNKFDYETKSFLRYKELNKFPLTAMYGVLEDNKRNLWISSDDGLWKFNLLSEISLKYKISHGLQSLEFNGGTYLKNNMGEMFFGGVNGFNFFYPDSVRNNSFIPPVVISSIKIFDEELRGTPTELTLSYEENFFSISFSTLDYTNPSENVYAYKLEGFENEWRHVDARLRTAYYTNLKPGEYVFKVKGTNSDGIWNNKGAEISIIILPPFWRTWWFISIAFILAVITLYNVFTIRYRQLLSIEKIKTKLAADLHDNVGAGLTEIAILSELTSKELPHPSKFTTNRLDKISDTARILVDNMSDIVWVVNPKRDSLYDLVLRLKDSYRDFLLSLGISFKTNNLEKLSSIKLPMDYKQNLYLIFKEGINNAIKHSKCKKLFLDADVKGDILEITLRDDGIGMEHIGSRNGDGIRNIKDRAREIGGELKWTSLPNKGTSIYFTGKISRTQIVKNLFNFGKKTIRG